MTRPAAIQGSASRVTPRLRSIMPAAEVAEPRTMGRRRPKRSARREEGRHERDGGAEGEEAEKPPDHGGLKAGLDCLEREGVEEDFCPNITEKPTRQAKRVIRRSIPPFAGSPFAGAGAWAGGVDPAEAAASSSFVDAVRAGRTKRATTPTRIKKAV